MITNRNRGNSLANLGIACVCTCTLLAPMTILMFYYARRLVVEQSLIELAYFLFYFLINGAVVVASTVLVKLIRLFQHDIVDIAVMPKNCKKSTLYLENGKNVTVRLIGEYDLEDDCTYWCIALNDGKHDVLIEVINHYSNESKSTWVGFALGHSLRLKLSRKYLQYADSFIDEWKLKHAYTPDSASTDATPFEAVRQYDLTFNNMQIFQN